MEAPVAVVFSTAVPKLVATCTLKWLGNQVLLVEKCYLLSSMHALAAAQNRMP